MVDSPYKGGRSNKAPYKTTHVRTPVPVQIVLQRIVELYKIAVASGDAFLPDELINNLLKSLDGYHTWAGTLINSNKTVSLDEYHLMKKEIESLTYEVNDLKMQIYFHKKARQDIKAHLDEACKLKPNAGGAIKKKIREVIEILD